MKETCQRVDRLLNYFLEGSLSDQEKTFIENHLKKCPVCMATLPVDDWVKMVAPKPQIKCPDQVEAKVFSVIQSMQGDAAKGRWHALCGWKGALAGAVAAVMLLLLFHPPEPAKESTQTEFSREEIEQARDVVKWSLAYSAQMVRKNKKSTIDQVFEEYIPKSVQRSARKLLPLFSGGEK